MGNMRIEEKVRGVFEFDAGKHNLEGYLDMDWDARQTYVDKKINSLTNVELLHMISEAIGGFDE